MSIKYRTSAGTSASNFSDLVVKVGDTLPIGTEVDYDGQTAPAGWQEVEETNLGDVVVDSIKSKNLLDTKLFAIASGGIKIINNSDGTLDASTSNGWYSNMSATINVVAGKTYTIKYKATQVSGNYQPVVVVRKLDDSTNLLRKQGTGYQTGSFTTTENAVIIHFYISGEESTARTKYEEIQLEEGTTATNFEKHIDFYDDRLKNIEYTITNTPAHQVGTNEIKVLRSGNIVTINFDKLWLEPIQGNTWVTIGNVPNDIIPTYTCSSTCNAVRGDNGALVAYGKAELIKDTGVIQVRLNTDTPNYTCAVAFNITYIV